MNNKDNVANYKSTNKSTNPISAPTKNAYNGRLQNLAITNYTTIDEFITK